MNKRVDILLVYPVHDVGVKCLSIVTLKLFLEKYGFNVVVVDKPKNNALIYAYIFFLKPRFVGVSIPFSYLGPSALGLIDYLKKQNFNVPIVVGGTDVVLRSELYDSADYVCTGYGESFLLNLLSGCIVKKDFDINDLPSVYTDDRYVGFNGEKTMLYLGSRGCVFDCVFCSSRFINKKKVLFRSVDNVISDLKFFNDNNVFNVTFNDETFTLNQNRAKSICDGILDNDIILNWKCQTRIDMLNDDLLFKMKNSGCYSIAFGVETADDFVMKECNKKIDLDKVVDVVDQVKSYGIKVVGGFIVGFPSDTINSVKNTLDFSINCDFDFVTYSIMCPYPKTRVREIAISNGDWIGKDLSKYHSNYVNYVPSGLKGFDMYKLYLSCHGKFLRSSYKRFKYGYRSFVGRSGVRPKLDFARRILSFYGV